MQSPMLCFSKKHTFDYLLKYVMMYFTMISDRQQYKTLLSPTNLSLFILTIFVMLCYLTFTLHGNKTGNLTNFITVNSQYNNFRENRGEYLANVSILKFFLSYVSGLVAQKSMGLNFPNLNTGRYTEFRNLVLICAVQEFCYMFLSHVQRPIYFRYR